MGVLSGIRIVEIAGIGPGPFCGMLLADLGAEVIVIERPTNRKGSSPPRPGALTLRGKRSIEIDLKSREGVQVVLRLLRDADALIEGMRPGVMERLGLSPDACLQVNPGLVYGRMTGWGQSGPLAQAAGHDSNYLSLSGAMWWSAMPGETPNVAPTLIGDLGGGALYLAVGILAGILRVRAGGPGQVVDAAIIDGAAHLTTLLLGVSARHGGDFEKARHAFQMPHWSHSYLCADGGYIRLASLEPQFYAVLLQKLGLDDDPAFVSSQHDPEAWPGLRARLQALFLTRTRQEWCDVLEGSDACFAPVLNPQEAALHPHNAMRENYRHVDGVLQAAPAPRFSATPSEASGRISPSGADADDILGQAGYDPAEIDRLKSRGVVA